MRKLDSLSAAEIREAVAAIALSQPRSFASHNLVHAVAEHLGSSTSSAAAFTSTGYGITREQERYYGKVKRALDKLAADGTLARVAAGERLPDGRMLSMREVRYYTREAYEEAKARGDRERAERDAEQARWKQVGDRLEAAGIRFEGGPRTVNLDGWERLLGMAGL